MVGLVCANAFRLTGVLDKLKVAVVANKDLLLWQTRICKRKQRSCKSCNLGFVGGVESWDCLSGLQTLPVPVSGLQILSVCACGLQTLSVCMSAMQTLYGQCAPRSSSCQKH